MSPPMNPDEEYQLRTKLQTLRTQVQSLQRQLAARDGAALTEARAITDKLESSAAVYRSRWQRVLKAYRALFEVKRLGADVVHTPALAEYLETHRLLQKGDIEELE